MLSRISQTDGLSFSSSYVLDSSTHAYFSFKSLFNILKVLSQRVGTSITAFNELGLRDLTKRATAEVFSFLTTLKQHIFENYYQIHNY